MWVFDGEEWTEEPSSEATGARVQKPTTSYDELTPELQVIEIVPVPQTNHVPPFPLP